jgi:hypothetical protein
VRTLNSPPTKYSLLENGTLSRGWLQWFSDLADAVKGKWGETSLEVDGSSFAKARDASENICHVNIKVSFDSLPETISGLPSPEEDSILLIAFLGPSGSLAGHGVGLLSAGSTSASISTDLTSASAMIIAGTYRRSA